MNQAELDALQQPLSNAARVLYCLGLRPFANQHSGETASLSYKGLFVLLNDKHHQFKLGRQINALLKELHKAGLVSLTQEQSLERSLNGKTLILPMMLFSPDQFAGLHLQFHRMQNDWQPDKKLISELSQLVGLIDQSYKQSELGEFIAYWLGRPQNQFSQFQWTQKFVFHLKQQRQARGYQAVSKVGSQLVKNAPGISADDNAKKLVEQYKDKG